MGKTHPLLHLCAALLVAASTIVFGAEADAQEDPEDYGDTIHVVQPKPVLQQGRINVTPQLGVTINDPLYRGVKLGGRASMHFTERLYAGALFQYHDMSLLGGESQTYRDVTGETGMSVDAAYLNWGAGAELGFAPLFGKFSLFNRGIIFYNMSIAAGGGWFDSSSLGRADSAGAPAGMVALRGQFFFNEWMGVDAEVRNVIYPGTIESGDVLSHSVTFGAGVTFLFPQAFEYEEAETL